jgi:hypothetical protein
MESLVVIALLVVSILVSAAIAFGRGSNRCAVKPRMKD